MVNGAKKILLRVFQERGHCDGGKHSKLLYGLLIVFLDDGIVLFLSCVSAPQITGVRKCNGMHINVVIPLRPYRALISWKALINSSTGETGLFWLLIKTPFIVKQKADLPKIEKSAYLQIVNCTNTNCALDGIYRTITILCGSHIGASTSYWISAFSHCRYRYRSASF